MTSHDEDVSRPAALTAQPAGNTKLKPTVLWPSKYLTGANQSLH